MLVGNLPGSCWILVGTLVAPRGGQGKSWKELGRVFPSPIRRGNKAHFNSLQGPFWERVGKSWPRKDSHKNPTRIPQEPSKDPARTPKGTHKLSQGVLAAFFGLRLNPYWAPCLFFAFSCRGSCGLLWVKLFPLRVVRFSRTVPRPS